MNRKLSNLLITTGLCMMFLTLLTSMAIAQPEYSTYRGGLTGGLSTFNGLIAPIGSRIEIYDANDVLCGTNMIRESPGAGKYANTSVPNVEYSLAGEELSQGEILTFRLNGRVAVTTGPDEPIWDGNVMDFKEVNLSVEGATVAANFTTPSDQTALAGDVVHYMVMVENTGDGLDFYTATATSGTGWLIDYDAGLHYAEMGETITIQFDLRVPPGVLSAIDQFEFTITSVLDNSVTASGNLITTVAQVTDVESDDNSALPGGFRLYQNYPNPFNPATTISYNLPSSSVVNLFIFDVLGRKVNEFNLGIQTAGTHSYTFNAKTLSSGIYFYKIKTDKTSAMKRMLLLK